MFKSPGRSPRTYRVVAALASLAVTGLSLAATPPNPKDLTQGKWALDLSQSHLCDPTPKSSYREIIDAGFGLISVHWTGINADGKPMDDWYVYNYDGSKYPVGIMRPGTPKTESIAYTLVNPHRVDFVHYSPDGKVTQKLSRIVSEDGQTMTQTTDYVGGRNGKECKNHQVFRRQ